MKFDKTQIMKEAWRIKKSAGLSLSKSMKIAWCKAKNCVEKVCIKAGMIIPIFTKGQEIFLSQVKMINSDILSQIIKKDGESRPDRLMSLYEDMLDA